MSPEKRRWVDDNLSWIVPLMASAIMGVAGWGYHEYSELNESRIRHDERIRVMEQNNNEFDRKQEVMVKDIRDIKVSVERLAAIAEKKALEARQ